MKTRARDKSNMRQGRRRLRQERGEEIKSYGEREVEADRKMERFLGRDGEEGEEKETNQWKISSGVRCFG